MGKCYSVSTDATSREKLEFVTADLWLDSPRNLAVLVTFYSNKPAADVSTMGFAFENENRPPAWFSPRGTLWRRRCVRRWPTAAYTSSRQPMRCGCLPRGPAVRGGTGAGLLSRPTPRQPTPITTTALPFIVRVGPEGAMSVRLVGWYVRWRATRGLRGGEGEDRAPNHRPTASRVAPVGCACPALPSARRVRRPRSGRYTSP